MLKGIPKLLSPELIKILAEMGHGDEIVIGDANFPAVQYGRRVVRADGIGGAELLSAILSVMPLDTYAAENLILMEVVKGDAVVPVIWEDYRRVAAEKDAGRRRRAGGYGRALHRPAAICARQQDCGGRGHARHADVPL